MITINATLFNNGLLMISTSLMRRNAMHVSAKTTTWSPNAGLGKKAWGKHPGPGVPQRVLGGRKLKSRVRGRDLEIGIWISFSKVCHHSERPDRIRGLLRATKAGSGQIMAEGYICRKSCPSLIAMLFPALTDIAAAFVLLSLQPTLHRHSVARP